MITPPSKSRPKADHAKERPPEWRIKLRKVHFKSTKLSIHELANDAYDVWYKAFAMSSKSRGYFLDGLLDQDTLSTALACSPLPCVAIADNGSRPSYAVIGRFNIWAQIDTYHPRKITLAIYYPMDATGGGEDRLKTLLQSLLLVDSCARGSPKVEFEAVYDSTRKTTWPSLIKHRPSLGLWAKVLGCGVDALRTRRRRDRCRDR